MILENYCAAASRSCTRKHKNAQLPLAAVPDNTNDCAAASRSCNLGKDHSASRGCTGKHTNTQLPLAAAILEEITAPLAAVPEKLLCSCLKGAAVILEEITAPLAAVPKH
jgi:hypothetical protein